tara:strand:+ start:234 stop:566 length:333 start_codon:yes stop_codon:yes gene_type:complete
MAKTLNIAQRNLTELKKSPLDSLETSKDHQHALNAIDANIAMLKEYRLEVMSHAESKGKAVPIFVKGRTTVPLDKLKKAAEEHNFNWKDYVNEGADSSRLKLIDDGTLSS